MTPHKGHVQVAFERRTGQTLTVWLLENGPTMTLTEAAQAIGYAGHNPLIEFVARYLPAEFRFHRVPPMFSQEQVSEARARHLGGESWRKIAVSMGGDKNMLKGYCRRQRRAVLAGRGITGNTGKQSKLTADDMALAFELRIMGKSLDSIAAKLGVSRRYLSSRLMQCERDGVACIAGQNYSRSFTMDAHE